MALKILMAGCSDDERALLEPLVRAVIGQSRAQEAWQVTLVKVGKKLWTTMEGPGMPRVTFVVPEDELRASMLDAMRGANLLGETPSPAPGEATEESSEMKQDQHSCAGCQKPYVVTYEARPGEPQVVVPVACPNCWHVNQVPVGEWAAVGQEYRSGKV